MKGKTDMKELLESVLETEFSAPDDSSWRVYDCEMEGGCYELSGYSPAGENVIFTLWGDGLPTLAADAREAWENFDAEEHAAEILIEKRTGDGDVRRFYAAAPDSLRALLEDAEAIKAMYGRVADALEAAAERWA